MSTKAKSILGFGLIIVLMSSVMRTPLTNVGPLAEMISDSLSLSAGNTGLITSIPLFTFAVLSIPAARLSERLGITRVLFLGMVSILIGFVLRSLFGAVGLYTGTVFIGAGIAAANVLVPAFIKQRRPEDYGIFTATYSTTMSITSAAAGAIAIPVANMFNWQISLAVWVPMAAAAVFCLLPMMNSSKRSGVPEEIKKPKVHCARHLQAWSMALYMGTQSLLFYTFAAWMTMYMQSKGFDAETAGLLDSIYILIGMVGAMFMPAICSKVSNLSLLAVVHGSMYAASIAVLTFTQNAYIAAFFLVFIGLLQGCSMPYVLMLFGMRTHTAEDAAALSGFSQSIGYALAAIGPACMGMLMDFTGSWDASMIAMIFFAASLAVNGYIAGRKTYIED